MSGKNKFSSLGSIEVNLLSNMVEVVEVYTRNRRFLILAERHKYRINGVI
jgi:hypothetical protein